MSRSYFRDAGGEDVISASFDTFTKLPGRNELQRLVAHGMRWEGAKQISKATYVRAIKATMQRYPTYLPGTLEITCRYSFDHKEWGKNEAALVRDLMG